MRMLLLAMAMFTPIRGDIAELDQACVPLSGSISDLSIEESPMGGNISDLELIEPKPMGGSVEELRLDGERLVPAPRIPQPKGYPLRGSWWTGCSSWAHMTGGAHAGKFDPAWLRGLSWGELQSLHSDDHEGRVQWSRVVRPQVSTVAYRPRVAIPQSGVIQSRNTTACPGGRCPTVRYKKGRRR